MFMMSVRLSPKRILIGAVALVLVAGAGAAGLRALNGGSMASAPAEAAETRTVDFKAKKILLKTPEEHLAFIQSFGWEVSGDSAEIQEVIIPKEFDAVYEQYNSLQKKQGYDLEKYAGKRAKRYSYVITNYPGEEGEVRFNLLLCGDRVVGGDVCTLRQDGFMHGFAMQ